MLFFQLLLDVEKGMRYCLLKSQSWVITARSGSKGKKSNPDYSIAVDKKYYSLKFRVLQCCFYNEKYYFSGGAPSS